MVESLIILMAVVVSLLFACLLSASETAITAMSTAKIYKLKTDGNKRAIIISKLREDKESLISTILLANNGCNILASTMATAFLIKIFGSEGVIYSTLIMTILIIVFAEVLPKTYAISDPERVALKFAYLLKITVMVCSPIIKLINKFVDLVTSNFKMEHSCGNLVSPTEEIKGTIDLHHKQGLVDHSNKYMLDGVFYLSETTVGKVMTHRKNMQSININLDIKDILAQVKTIGHARIPVWKDKPDNIVGILYTRELLHSLLTEQDISKINIADLISESMFIHENTALDEQLREFKTRKTRFAIVIDEYGDIKGLITLSDILEEVVGRIQDEHDHEKNSIIWQNNHCIVKGEVTIRDINRELNWQIPDNGASTIAGLLIHEAERVPDVGEVLVFHGFSFNILAKEFNQLTTIKIEKNI